MNAEPQQSGGKQWKAVLLIASIALTGAAMFAISRIHQRTPSPPSSEPTAFVHFQNGLRLAKEGNTSAAEVEWKTAIGLDPAFPPPYITLAEHYVKDGNFAAAAKQLELLKRTNPRAAHVDCRMAEIHTRADRFPAAVTAAKTAVGTEPKCARAYGMLGMAYANSGDAKEASRALRRSYELDPSNDTITIALAQVLAQTGSFNESKELAGRLATGPSTHRVQANYAMGWILSLQALTNRQMHREAEVYLRKALELDPNHGPANAQMGILLTRLHRYAEARTYLERARSFGGTSAKSMEALAEVYVHLKLSGYSNMRRVAKTLEQSSEALRKSRRRYLSHPDDTHNVLKLAELEANRGRKGDALELTKAVLQKDPDNSTALSLLYRLTAQEQVQDASGKRTP